MRTEITWDNLEKGDVLQYINGEECKVLAVIGDVVFVAGETNKVFYVDKYDSEHEIVNPAKVHDVFVASELI